MNLLQTAGFSKSNPYYIVPQGRVTALTNAKDADRLQLLKEVAGTKIYEEHREESLKIMKETEGKREKIVELLGFIDERLGELEREKEELGAYFELDRERRACEYLLYSREQAKAGEALAKLESEFKAVLESDASRANVGEEQAERIRELEGQLETVVHSLSELKRERSLLGEDREQLSQQKTQTELTLADLEEEGRRCREEEARLEQALQALEAEIVEKEQTLGQVVPQANRLQSEEGQLRQRLGQISREKEALLAKRARAGQFRSEAERNKWLAKEIAGLQAAIEVDEGQRGSLEEEVESFAKREADLRKAIELDELSPATRLQDLDYAYQEARQQRDVATESRKELWRAQAKLEASLRAIGEEIEGLQRETCSQAGDKAALAAIEAVERIALRLGLQGAYHGPLYQLFDVKDAVFSTVTDIVGGSSLFHVVVDDDGVASQLLEALVREAAGRVTFMPLNRLKARRAEFTATAEAIPLLDKLAFDEAYAAAMAQVFGKAVVCKDLTVAAAVAKTHGLDTITLGGDRVSRKGALTGGSTDTRKRNRLEALRRLAQWQAKRFDHEETARQVQLRIREIDQQVTIALGQMQLVDCQRSELRLGKAQGDLEVRRKELGSLGEILAAKRASITKLSSGIETMQQKIAAYQAEVQSAFSAGLSAAEEARFQSLGQQFEALNRDYAKASRELSSVLQAQSALETELELNLRRKRTALNNQLVESSSSRLEKTIRMHQASLGRLTEKLEHCVALSEKIDAQLVALAKEEASLSATLEKARALLDANESGEHQQAMARYLAKRRVLVQKRSEAAEKARDVGVVPEEAFGPLRDLPDARLMDRLHEAKEALRAFGPVNKKAGEQHGSFSKQGEALRKRLEELEASAKAISDFIGVLDQRKDEAIQRTFEGVSEAFSEIFARLVPTGHARLEMLREDGGAAEWTGVGMRASFNATSGDEGLLMGQLSGGQKSLLSLALIFAIQRTDPAPFYLFDEVDAALDAAHRTSLAALLDALSHDEGAPTQFICTTFRPELLDRADAFFGVSFGSRVSRVEAISKEQALEFIETSTA